MVGDRREGTHRQEAFPGAFALLPALRVSPQQLHPPSTQLLKPRSWEPSFVVPLLGKAVLRGLCDICMAA